MARKVYTTFVSDLSNSLSPSPPHRPSLLIVYSKPTYSMQISSLTTQDCGSDSPCFLIITATLHSISLLFMPHQRLGIKSFPLTREADEVDAAQGSMSTMGLSGIGHYNGSTLGHDSGEAERGWGGEPSGSRDRLRQHDR